MKLLKIATLALCFISITTFGQTEKGSFFMGASSDLNFRSYTLEIGAGSVKNTQFNISPSAGYFVIDDLAAGLGFNYSHSKSGDVKANSFAIVPALKYYFLEGKTRVFAHANYSFGTTKFDFVVINPIGGGTTATEVTSDTNSYQIGAGLALFLNDFISLELSLNYFNQTMEGDNSNPLVITNDQEESGFASSVGFVIFL